METIGDIIYRMRMARGWTQKALSIESGLPMSSISAYEARDTLPGALSLMALADAFECSIDELVGRPFVGGRTDKE